MKTATLIKELNALSYKQLQDLAAGLVWYDACQAERLRNSIIVAQQEKDLGELELQKQQEMMSRDSDMEYVNV